MIITKTPFRISFFGGGTDYPAHYLKHGGNVLSTTIDKYCYITSRYLPPFFNFNYNLVYSSIEKTHNISEIKHPAIKSVIEYLKISEGLEIHYAADLPARSGLGSSSSFVVGLLQTLNALKGKMMGKMELALEAIKVEQEIIKESVGSQDQVAAAFGGINKIEFNPDGSINVSPLIIKNEKKSLLESHLLFLFTGFTRFASEIANEQVKSTPNKESELKNLFFLVDEAINVLNSDNNFIKDFGVLLNESWQIKRNLTSKISTSAIDEIYSTAIANGAFGGKLIGAGGGGFMVFIAPPEKHKIIISKLKKLLQVPIKFDNTGSQIIFYNPEKI